MAAVILVLAVLAILGVDKLYHEKRRINRRLAHLASQKAFVKEYAQAIEQYNKSKNHFCNRKSGF